MSYSDRQSNTDLLRENIETFVINGGNNVDGNALECLTNDEPDNLQTTGAIDEEELNDVVYAIFHRVTNDPSDLPTCNSCTLTFTCTHRCSITSTYILTNKHSN